MLELGYGLMLNTVLYSKELTDKQKLLFCSISSLCAEKGYCRAKNKHFAELFGVHEITISKNISLLQKKGFIFIVDDGDGRKIYICEHLNCLSENTNGVSKNAKGGLAKMLSPYIYMNNTKENISSKEEIETSSITSDINNLINELKQECDSLGIAYDKTKERQFAKHILSAKEYGSFCEKIGMGRVEFASSILKASVLINYWKGACSGPMKIYQNYADVYNKTKELHTKNQKNLIQSF